MRHTTLLLPAILVALLLNAAAMGKEAGATEKPKYTAIKGTIAKIDGQSVTITQQKEGAAAEDVTVTVDEKTRIMVDGEKSELSKLKVGDTVRGAYTDAKVAMYIAKGVNKAAGGSSKKSR